MLALGFAWRLLVLPVLIEFRNILIGVLNTFNKDYTALCVEMEPLVFSGVFFSRDIEPGLLMMRHLEFLFSQSEI